MLGFQHEVAPLGIRRAAKDELAEVAEEAGFLRGGVAAAVFTHGHHSIVAFHVEVAHVLVALGVAYGVTNFTAVKGHHEIVETNGAVSAAHVRPLLVAGQEGTVEARGHVVVEKARR